MRLLSIICFAATLAASGLLRAEDLCIQVNAASGDYTIAATDPAWRFGGSLGAPVSNVTTNPGHDGIGSYRETAFEWKEGDKSMGGKIRLYEGQSLALFLQTCREAAATPPAAFPSFTRLPESLHVFSFGHHEFAPPNFAVNQISTPWLLFDSQANVFLISPASHFMVARMVGDGRGEVSSGFNPELRDLPAGFTQQTLVVFGKGINKTWERWGRALLEWQGAKRPGNDADDVLKYLGYWTDNGSTYYYNYNLDKGYAGTLEELVSRYRQEQIPIRYLQLDSWWYYKTTTSAEGLPGKEKKAGKLPSGEWNRYGGLLQYKAHTDLFPQGLEAFQRTVGLPLVTHSRWIDPASPYHQQYKISGLAAVDPKWWNHIADYMKTSGIVTYEQDWLDRIYTYSPAFSSNVATGQDFLDDMARACKEEGITMQYCMPYPCYFLQGSRYKNLTTIRASGDRFNTNRWNDFLYTSRLASALGIWPWTDVCMSGEVNNVLLSTLSAGPVGIGDPIGTDHKEVLLQAVRADGVIVKPDASIVPLDQSYVADAEQTLAPLVSSTFTDHDGVKTKYVFAFNRRHAPADEVHFTLGELGLSGPAYVYDYFTGTGRLLLGNDTFAAPLDKSAAKYFVVAPVGQSGIAFLGDKNKFVGTGRQRIASMRDEPGKLTVDVILAASEKSVMLHGFAISPPEAPGAQYDPRTKIFSIEVKSDDNAPVDRSSGDPVRRVTVTLKTKSS